MQAYSPHNPVGAQHKYTSVFNAWTSIVKAEGPKGLFRGMDAAILRTAMGSSVQLPAYGLAKTTLTGWGLPDNVFTFLLSSSFSGMCTLIAMQPAGTSCFVTLLLHSTTAQLLKKTNVISPNRYCSNSNVYASTQLYRSGWKTSRIIMSVPPFLALCLASLLTRNTDKNPIDCLYKTLKTEGFLGWYKGSFAHCQLFSQFLSLVIRH